MVSNVLLALTIGASAATGASDRHQSAIDLLDHTVWSELGLWENPAKLTPRRLAELRACANPSMSFEKTGDGLEQIFYAGIALRTHYSPVKAAESKQGTTISLYSGGNNAHAEILRLGSDRAALIQEAPGFRPHAFVRCDFPDRGKPPKGRTNKLKR